MEEKEILKFTDPVKQKVIVRSTDRIKFVQELLDMGSLGAKLAYNTVPRMICPFTAELEVVVERSSPLKSSPTRSALPLDIRRYTPSELEAMVWEEFREAVREAGVKGRDREIMMEDYFKALKERDSVQ